MFLKPVMTAVLGLAMAIGKSHGTYIRNRETSWALYRAYGGQIGPYTRYKTVTMSHKPVDGHIPSPMMGIHESLLDIILRT